MPVLGIGTPGAVDLGDQAAALSGGPSLQDVFEFLGGQALQMDLSGRRGPNNGHLSGGLGVDGRNLDVAANPLEFENDLSWFSHDVILDPLWQINP